MPSLILLNQPDYLLPQVVAFLTEGWEGGLLDLSETALVLPTQEARRRLHEALVRKAASQDSALLPPIWLLPMQLPEGDRRELAPVALDQLLWIATLSAMSPAEARRLFPRKAPLLDPPRASELADSIRSLRGELSQAGMSLRQAQQQRPEDQRWKTLISLEECYLQKIAEAGFIDRITAQLEGARHPILPAGAKHLAIAGVPDLPKVYDSLLPKLEAQGIPITILSYDPQQFGREYFDGFGRPREAWTEIPIPIEQNMIHLCLDRSEEAEKSALLVQASGGSSATTAVGLTSVELAKPLHDALKTLGISVFNPAGETLDALPIGRLLSHFSEFLREDDFRTALQILRHPDMQRWLALDAARDLKTLDALANALIPSSLKDLLERWPSENSDQLSISETLRPSLQSLHDLLSTLREGEGPTPLLAALQSIYTSADLASLLGGKESAEKIRAWVQGGELLMERIHTQDLITLLLSHLQSAICTREKKPGSVELSGWLELLWEDAPHLIVAGMNDGLVPELREGDPFLHEKLRVEWGLSSDAGRLRRDSYLLLCLMATRSEAIRSKEAARSGTHGRVDLLLAHQDDEGGVLKPSRLLFRCAEDEELPRRVQELFRELPPRPSEKWQAAWALKPERKTPPRTLSASALRDYLACPARFYLKHVLRLRSEKFGAEEADAPTFGILLHETLRDFGNDPKLRNLHAPEQIESALVRIWKQHFDTRYGTETSFPLIYQREAGIRRLRGAALAQAALRHEGWEIVACERDFKDFRFAGMRLRGQIDRIDRRVTTTCTEWRVIDYKSSEAVKNPNEQHYRLLGKRDLPPYERFELNDKAYRWIDLQLPLYRMVLLSDMENGHSSHLMLDDLAKGSVEAGYLILPAKISETKFQPFTEIEQHEESASACLSGILGAIHQGKFWPPRQPKYEDFGNLLFDRLKTAPLPGQQTLDPENLSPRGLAEEQSGGVA